MKKLLTAVASSAGLLGSVAHSEENNKMYLEVGYAHAKLESSGLPSVTPGVIAARFGYNFTKNFAAEAFLATGVSSKDIDVAGIPVSVKIDSAYGVYLKAKVEVGNGFELFAKPGYIHAKLKASAGGFSASTSDDSFSWAIGGQYNFTDRMYGQLDYASYYDKQGDKVSGPSISIGWKF